VPAQPPKGSRQQSTPREIRCDRCHTSEIISRHSAATLGSYKEPSSSCTPRLEDRSPQPLCKRPKKRKMSPVQKQLGQLPLLTEKRDSLANYSAEPPALLEYPALLETAGMPALAQERAPSARVAGRARVSEELFQVTQRCLSEYTALHCAARCGTPQFAIRNSGFPCGTLAKSSS